MVFGKFLGRDIGVNLPTLLNAIVAELPPDASTMLRIGMTNPPFILEHLKEIAEVLRHPCVYSFLHVPVQSGSDAVLNVNPNSRMTPFFLLLLMLILLPEISPPSKNCIYKFEDNQLLLPRIPVHVDFLYN